MNLLQYVQTHSYPADLEVVDFTGSQAICERLHEMGIHRGQQIRVLGRAPLKGPLLIQFGLSFIALRGEEAECTLIQAL